jgi:probable HAF family extracellular repeat protein
MKLLSLSHRVVLLPLVVLGAAAAASAQTYSIRDIGTLEFSVSVTRMNDAGQVIGQSDTSTGHFGFLSTGSTMVHLTLGGTHSQALDLNAAGDVVGWSYLGSNFAQHAFVYRQGVMHDLNDLLPANSGWVLNYARAINDAGQIVGQGVKNGQTRAFLYTPAAGGATIVDLGTLGGTNTWPEDINSSGQITGYSHVTNNNSHHAFRYSAGTMTDLGTLGGTYSFGTAINDAGQVTGWAYTSFNNSQHAFLYSGGSMIDIGTFGGTHSVGHDINESGHVVGYAYVSNNASYHAFRFANGVLTDLGTLGGTYSMARAINDDGDITGWSYTSGNSQQRAFLFKAGSMQDLSNLLAPCSGRQLFEGLAINENAQIAGRGNRPSVSFGFVMSPGAPGSVLTSTLSVRPASGFYGESVGLTAILSAEACGVSGANVAFSLNGVAGQTDATDANGFAFVGASLAGINAGTYPNGVQATFAGDPTHSAASDTADLLVRKAVNVITWNTPASISYGTPLGVAQLNATASTSGTFSYSPASGTVLPPGTHGLTVVFIPDDQLNHASPISRSVPITVTGGQLPFTMADLGTLGGAYSQATSVNGAGQVTGWAYDSSQNQRAFFYSNGVMTAIPTFGGTHSYPSGGINSVGTVAGRANTANNASYHAFVFKNGQLTDLGTLGGPYSDALALNDAGQVTGWAYDANHNQRAFLYSNGTMTNISTLGGTYSYPSGGINASGSVAGYSYVAGNSGHHAFLYRNGQMTDLGTLGGTYSLATALNDNHQVTGWAYTSTNEQRAFLYTNGTMINLGTFGGTHSHPQGGINASGQVAGYAYLTDNSSRHAFLYSNGTLIDLGTLGGLNSFAYDLNDAGDVVGESQTPNGQTHAFLYRNGSLVDLGTLGGGFSTARKINENGDVTGIAQTANGEQHAFLYRNGVMTDLGTLGGTHSDPSAGISTASHVAGYAYITGNSSYHAFLATPTTATTILQASSASGPFGGTTTLTAVLTSGTAPFGPLPGRTVQFSINGVNVGSAITNATGTATLASASLAGVSAGVHTGGIQAVFAGALDYQASNDSADLTVGKITPVVTWNTPADITYGTLLGAAQLNATANVPGTFTYTPASGTNLSAGNGQTLSVAFTPDDLVSYEEVPLTTVTINVLAATPVVSWNTPAAISYGTLLGAAQLNATANVPGTFVYSPAAGTMLSAGSNQILSVAFTPTDANYTAVPATTVSINVLKGTPVVSWNAPADIVYGTLLGGTQLNATADVPGTFTYTPAAGTKLNAGNNQALSVAFAPADAVNYNAVPATTTSINVLKATPVVSWTNPADIVYGTLLGGPQLNATADVLGTFTYTPAAGTKLNAGNNQVLSVAFAPTDAANYNAVPATTTSINVLKATPTLNWANPSDIVYGTALGAAQLNATSPVTGAFTYSPLAGTVLSAGQGQTLNVTFTPTDTANYHTASKSVALAVKPAPLTIAADAKSMVLNAAMPGLTATYGGFVNGDTSASLTPGVTLGTAATGEAVGSFPINASGAANPNYTITHVPGTLTVSYATGLCLGQAGRQVLEPVNVDGSSVFKRNSTVPVKFRVCDVNGNSIGSPNVVSGFAMIQVLAGTVSQDLETIESTTPDSMFRWDPTALQWIFNLSTKSQSANRTYVYRITLADQSVIEFRYGLR